jgi:hypothetical protein
VCSAAKIPVPNPSTQSVTTERACFWNDCFLGSSLTFFFRVGSIYAIFYSIHASSLGILGKKDALSAGPDFLGAVGILHARNSGSNSEEKNI